jgi:hypothetical protein
VLRALELQPRMEHLAPLLGGLVARLQRQLVVTAEAGQRAG